MSNDDTHRYRRPAGLAAGAGAYFNFNRWLETLESEEIMTPEQLADEIDQLRQSYRIQQKTIARLNSEIGDLRAENTRLLEVIRLQAPPVIDEMALAIAAGQAGFDWQADEAER